MELNGFKFIHNFTSCISIDSLSFVSFSSFSMAFRTEASADLMENREAVLLRQPFSLVELGAAAVSFTVEQTTGFGGLCT